MEEGKHAIRENIDFGMKLEMVSVARSTILFIMVLIREVLVSMSIKDALIDLKLGEIFGR
jgi:hypothetical protein